MGFAGARSIAPREMPLNLAERCSALRTGRSESRWDSLETRSLRFWFMLVHVYPSTQTKRRPRMGTGLRCGRGCGDGRVVGARGGIGANEVFRLAFSRASSYKSGDSWAGRRDAGAPRLSASGAVGEMRGGSVSRPSGTWAVGAFTRQ
jgi:hypothetical protein